ncbi:MAG: hypothetical protein ACRDK1_06410, partial [Solirubrobacterales bacterium]
VAAPSASGRIASPARERRGSQGNGVVSPDQTFEPRRAGPERVLPFACLASALVLAASELMTTFQLVAQPAPGGAPLCAIGAAERHHDAVAVIAAFAIVAMLVAVFTGSRPAAVAVAVAGVMTLLIFVIVDLPKANAVGNISSACNAISVGAEAKALPQAGFWLELVGGLALTLTGVALATLSSDQLRALRPGRRPKPPTAKTEGSPS